MAMSTRSGRSSRECPEEWIDRINEALIYGFALAADIAEEMGQQDEARLLKMRLLAYDSSNTSRLDPTQKEAVDSIREILSELQNTDRHFDLADWETLGLCYLAIGSFSKSLDAFNRATSLPRAVAFSFNTIFAMGAVYHHFKLYEKAERLYQGLIDNCSDTSLVSDALFRMGLLYRSDGKYQKALACFEKVRAAPPAGLRRQDVDLQVAYTLQKLGRNEEAGRMYREFRMNYPNLLPVTQQYVWFLYLTGMSSTVPALQRNASLEVAEILKRSLGQFPSDPVLMLQYARVAMRRDDMSTAFGLCKNCLSYWSDSAGFWGFLGILYYKNDQPVDAAAAFQRAVFLQTDMMESRLNLAYIMMTCPDFKEKLRSMDIHNLIGPNTPIPKQIVDIDDSKYFVQIPEQFAHDYVTSVPVFKLATSKVREMSMAALATVPQTLFC